MVSPGVTVAAILVGLGIGVVLQKSKLCHASMLSDLFLFRTLSRNGKGLLVATGLTMLAWSVIYATRGAGGFWLPAWGWYGILGGTVFGIGMIAAGGCMMSALYRAATGDVQYLLTLLATGVGYLAYGLAYPFFLEHYFQPLWLGSGASLYGYAGLFAPVLALLVIVGGLILVAWNEGRTALQVRRGTPLADGGRHGPAQTADAASPVRALQHGLAGLASGGHRYLDRWRPVPSLRTVVTSRWDPRTGGVALAVLAALWLLLDGVWTVSGPEAGWVALVVDTAGLDLVALEQWERAMFGASGVAISPNMIVIAAAGIGALLAAVVAGEFRVRKPEARTLPYAVGGGFLMGVGASLAPGCNIGNLFTGLAQLSLHGGVASIGMVIGAYLATRWLF
jgi:uncharacterized membrane protein YedE/YeeE